MGTPLDLAFKGNRDYAQGPDIYGAVVDNLGLERDAPFRIVIHHFARRQCELVLGAPGSSPANPVALFWTTRGGTALHGWVVERSQDITRRMGYDEEPIWSRCQRSGNEIQMTSPVPGAYTPVEVLVSLTKKLHLDAFAGATVKWAFTQLDVARLLEPSDVEELRVRIDQSLGTRFTKSSVFVGTKVLGTIHFAGVARS